MATKPLSKAKTGLKWGFRSGLEEKVAKQLTDEDMPFKYEQLVIGYAVPERTAKYTPDFVLLNNNIIIETKGRFMLADRKKHVLVKQQCPDLDIRFVFSNSRAKISKASKTSYADWCNQHGFKYADKLIPLEWLNESK